MKMKIERTKKGVPCIWESGGGYTNTGNATIISNKNGSPKKPIYIRQRGELANRQHALIPVTVGDYVLKADHHREDFNIFIYKIKKILKEEILTEKIGEFSNGEWDHLPKFLENAVKTAIEKATCYHCREPHFVIK